MYLVLALHPQMAATTEVKKDEKKKVAKPKTPKTGDEKKVSKKAAATTPSKDAKTESKKVKRVKKPKRPKLRHGRLYARAIFTGWMKFCFLNWVHCSFTNSYIIFLAIFLLLLD